MKKTIILLLAAAATMALLSACSGKGSETQNTESQSAETQGAEIQNTGIETVKDGDVVIPIADVDETAKFYPAEIDGTKLEVIAVKAPDGTIRTAFNTCQVCFDSGRGYYKQDGGVLVCQNCGNRFPMDQVEVKSGGCNPVPIFDDNKTVDDTKITISLDYLKKSTALFSNWKTEV
jgi:uncharacterized membrane protein